MAAAEAPSVLDVDAVERHMQALLQAPGANRLDIPQQPTLDAVTQALKQASLSEHVGEMPMVAIQRYHLLQVRFVDAYLSNQVNITAFGNRTTS